MIALGSRIGGVWRVVLASGAVGTGETFTAALIAANHRSA